MISKISMISKMKKEEVYCWWCREIVEVEYEGGFTIRCKNCGSWLYNPR